jgi:hypothetical protein
VAHGILAHVEAERPQGRSHQLRVLAEERTCQRDRFVAQGGQQQRPIGQTLRSGQHDLTARGAGEGRDRQEIGQRHGRSSVAHGAELAKEFLNARVSGKAGSLCRLSRSSELRSL